jgi:hypothetical protein
VQSKSDEIAPLPKKIRAASRRSCALCHNGCIYVIKRGGKVVAMCVCKRIGGGETFWGLTDGAITKACPQGANWLFALMTEVPHRILKQVRVGFVLTVR